MKAARMSTGSTSTRRAMPEHTPANHCRDRSRRSPVERMSSQKRSAWERSDGGGPEGVPPGCGGAGEPDGPLGPPSAV